MSGGDPACGNLPSHQFKVEASLMAAEATKSREGVSTRWYQFRLSTLLLIVLIVALALGWWVDRSRLAAQIPAQPQGIKTFSVVYADATDLSNALRELLSKDESDPVFVAVDPRAKTIIVRGPTDKLAEVEALVLRLDK
jgi:type II secretory pathway component GspD/PulD (secretin)